MAQFLHGTRADGSTVVRVVGEVDLAALDDLTSAVLPCLAEGKHVELELSRMEFIDSSGLGALVQLLKEAVRKGGSLSLTDVTASTYRLLEVTGLAGVFDVRRAGKDADDVGDA